MKLYWESAEAGDFDSILRLIPDGVLNSPRRSVVPLVDFFRVPSRGLASLEQVLQSDLTRATELRFEHAVPVQRGYGWPSYTDLLVLAPGVSVAIEVKYTEPRYPTVRKWLGAPREPNREAVLARWTSLIARGSGVELDLEELLNLPYQLIHRLASACSTSAPEKRLVYMLFGTDAFRLYVADVRALDRLLGTRAHIGVDVVSVPMTGDSRFAELTAAWDAGERQLAAEVRTALFEGPLFSFGPVIPRYTRAATP
jgi:hypothetical protein